MVEIWLAEPRGFCSGVCRALDIVNETLKKYGPPVYVRNEIVHNKHIVSSLKQRGVIFVEDLAAADPERPLIISAHGASPEVFEQAEKAGFNLIDATCPLVSKVHRQVKKFAQNNMSIIIIGKENHPEVIGTVGQAGTTNVYVINQPADLDHLDLKPNAEIGFVTQTTLSVDQTQEIVSQLKQLFPQLRSPKDNDICYATTHRQNAVKAIAAKSDLVIIIGSKNSSNSSQLQNTAIQAGAKPLLIDDVSELDLSNLAAVQNIGISAGASAPEYLVEDLLSFLQKHYDNINIHNVIIPH